MAKPYAYGFSPRNNSLTSLSPVTKIIAPESLGLSADYYTDGMADDIQINAAIQAVLKLGGGVILIKAGTYNLVNTINLGSNIIVKGEGYGSTFLQYGANITVNSNIVYGSNITNFQIKDITINGAASQGAYARGLFIANNSSYGLIERVQVLNSQEGLHVDSSSDIVVERCIANNNFYWDYYCYNNTRVKFYRNTSLNVSQGALVQPNGFGFAFYVNNIGCELTDNYVFNSFWTSIEIHAGNPNSTEDSVAFVCRDNYVSNSRYRGIYCLVDNPQTFLNKRMLISGNRAINCSEKGFYVNTADSIIMQGNISYGNVGDGFGYENSTNIISTNNISENNQSYGFRVKGSGASISSINDIILNNTQGLYAPNTLNSGLQTINTGTIISSSNQALAVGPNGITNPVFQVDASAPNAATGIRVIGAAPGGGVEILVNSSNATEQLLLKSKGTLPVVLSPGSDTTNAILFQNGANSANKMRFDTTNGRMRLGDGGTPGDTLDILGKIIFASGGLLSKYNSIATAGYGHPAIYGSGRSTGQTGAVASVASYTLPASDGSFIVSANVNITTFSAGTFNVTVTYTDETNTSRTLTLNFSSVTGTLGIAIAAAGAFEGIPAHIRAKASTTITIATSGTFTSLTYNVEGLIQQIA